MRCHVQIFRCWHTPERLKPYQQKVSEENWAVWAVKCFTSVNHRQLMKTQQPIELHLGEICAIHRWREKTIRFDLWSYENWSMYHKFIFLIAFNWNGIENGSDKYNTYIFLDVLVRIIAGYIYKLRRFFCQVFLLISHKAGKARPIENRNARYRLKSLFYVTR